MKVHLFFLVILFAVSIYGCGNNSESETKDTGESKTEDKAEHQDLDKKQEAFIQEIEKLRGTALNEQNILEKSNADHLISRYADFVNQFPDHPNSDDYLIDAASVAYSMSQFMAKDNRNNKGYCQKAVALAKRYLAEYPEGEKLKTAFDLITTILDFDLEDDDAAIEYYRMYKAAYPADSTVQQNCRKRIRYPHVTVEEIISGNTPKGYLD